MYAIQGAPCPRPGLRVSRVSGSYEGRVASCRVQLLLLYSGGGSNCKRFQISRCSGARYGGFSGAANRGLVFSSSKRKLYTPGLRDDEGCGRRFGRKIFAVGGGEQQQGCSDDDDDDSHQSEKEDVGDVSKSGEKKREDGAIVVERVGGPTSAVIDGGNGAVGHADISVSSSHVDDAPLRNAGSQEEPRKETSTSTSFDVMAVPTMLWERILQNPLVAFIRSWPAWQQRRKLEQLLAEADSQPQDATKQAALLAELFKQRFSHFASHLLLLRNEIEKLFILWMTRTDFVHEENGNFWSSFFKITDSYNAEKFTCTFMGTISRVSFGFEGFCGVPNVQTGLNFLK